MDTILTPTPHLQSLWKFMKFSYTKKVRTDLDHRLCKQHNNNNSCLSCEITFYLLYPSQFYSVCFPLAFITAVSCTKLMKFTEVCRIDVNLKMALVQGL